MTDVVSVTVWPTYIQFHSMEEIDRVDLTTTGRAINHFAKHMATKTNQRVGIDYTVLDIRMLVS